MSYSPSKYGTTWGDHAADILEENESIRLERPRDDSFVLENGENLTFQGGDTVCVIYR